MSESDGLSESLIIFHFSIHIERYQLSSFGAVTHLSATFRLPQISMLPSLSLQSRRLLDPLILSYAGLTAHFKKSRISNGAGITELQNERISSVGRGPQESSTTAPGPAQNGPQNHTMYLRALCKCFLNSVITFGGDGCVVP